MPPDTIKRLLMHPVGAAAAVFGGLELVVQFLQATSGSWFALAGALAGLGRHLTIFPEALTTNLFIAALGAYAILKLAAWLRQTDRFLDKNL